MGLSPFNKGCLTNTQVVAPNPLRWELLQMASFSNAYVLKVKYIGCTNFEGVKIMVYEGKYGGLISLDPHFADNDKSPIARFKPDNKGWDRALALAKSIR